MEIKIHDWLRAPECSVNFQAAADKRTQGTGQWILEHSKYENWKETSNVLWIQGKAGSGKTILLTTIIQDLRETAPRNVWYHYFDFRDNTGLKSTYRGLLLSLLQQVGSNADGIHSELMNLFDRCKQGISTSQPTVCDLENVLRSILVDVGLGYIVMDAMDECQEKYEVYQWLNEVGGIPNLYMVITSRDHFEPRTGEIYYQISLNNSGIDQDITMHLDREIVKYGFKGKLQDEIRESLIVQAQGQFRWVDCQLKNLQKCGSPSSTRKALQKLPRDLEETYTEALEKAYESDDAENAHHILLWLTYAFEPLNIGQISTMLAVDLERENVEEEGQMDFKLHLILDSNLVTVDQNRTVLFAHASVKEFLMKSRNITTLFQINAVIAHEKLAQACLIYLMKFVSYDQYFQRKGHWGASITFGDYAVFNWPVHVRRVEEEDSESKVFKLIRSLLQGQLKQWVARYNPGYVAPAEPLHWAAALGLARSVDLLLEGEAEVNAQGGPWGNALQAAVHNGNESIVSVLLQNGAEVNALGGFYGNALYAAADNGNESLVRVLLQKGADVNARGGYHGSALQAAAIRDHEAIVKLLLEKGADVHTQGGLYRNALHAAAHNGGETIVRALLENGAEVNAQGGTYGSALQAAAVSSHEAIVSLLLENGAEPNVQGGYLGNALQAAALKSHENIVNFLLEKGAEVNAQGGYYGNALQAAANTGATAIVSLLLEKGADVNAQGGYYGNALQAGAGCGHEAVVALLLEKGADVDTQGGLYGNALQAAADKGDQAIVSLLIAKGAQVNIQGGRYGNALQAAAANGHETIVNLLLQEIFPMSTQGTYYDSS
ncbi:ankyrin repeat-containing domain protein [Rhodocollybia butyracea]|uniref:Ankyrin repeat-containing domain protein n=1 Tax=Rhodocollybia butyracea TaxID=206335 RepID=A0A9P5P9X3_9AGAR|nr:ankyrin repeat-containing domain protein [Rhodocollybia butyracea]